jgi:hypothetical protein
MIPTAFKRIARATQTSVAASFDEARVATESELQNAISAIVRRASSGTLAALGSSICIVAPFKVSTPIVIPEECPGLTIRALSRFPVRAASVALSTMFDVRAEFVTIKDIFAYGDADGYFTTFVTATGSSASGRSADNLNVMNCVAFADRVYVDTAGDAADSLIFNVWQNEANNAHSAAITIDSPRVRVDSCWLEDGGGDSITITANASSCRITGNDLGGGDYTSTASGGFNTFSANTRVTTVTAHATDDTAGGNTA